VVPEWQLSLSNADLTGDFKGSWKPSPLPDSLGVLDLQGNIQQGDASRVHRYLPLSISQSVRYYVRDSVLKGSLQSVAVKIKGDLKQVPFVNPKEGEQGQRGSIRLRSTGKPQPGQSQCKLRGHLADHEQRQW